jgi:hypothetical protein
MLEEGQVQLRDLVMGKGTPWMFASPFNPRKRQVRVDQSGPRAWTHGSWSGAEFMEEAVIPMRLLEVDEVNGAWGWMMRMHEILAAFAPSKEDDLELRFMLGGVEYVMYGRPRMAEPDPRLGGSGYVNAAFVALDPLLYSGEENSMGLVLPTQSGGLVVPFTVPFTIDGVTIGNSAFIVNSGTATAALRFHIAGPVVEPRIAVFHDGVSTVLRFALTLTAGQWLDVDTRERTAYLNGTVSRRGQVYGDWPLLESGESEISFDASTYDASAALTVFWRDAWF